MESSSTEFNQVVNDIKSAEKKSSELKSNAESEAHNILKNAKEEVAKIDSKTEDSIVRRKNILLEKGVEKIESKVELIIDEAKKEASKLKNRKLKQTKTESFFEYILK